MIGSVSTSAVSQTPGGNGTDPVAGTQDAEMEAYVDTIAGTTVTFEMIPVPGGSVEVGGATVEVAPLWFGKTEISWDAYDVYTYGLDEPAGTSPEVDAVSRPSKPYVMPGESFGHQGNPALAMTFKAAQQYAEWLSAKTGDQYRLPTEAEWEHACEAGLVEGQALGDVAWYWDNANSQAHKLGSKAANAFGLHDMQGNAAEWVVGHDGTPVVKGGSWRDDPEQLDCSARQTQTPAWNMTDPQLPKSSWWLSDAPFVGFRLVREP